MTELCHMVIKMEKLSRQHIKTLLRVILSKSSKSKFCVNSFYTSIRNIIAIYNVNSKKHVWLGLDSNNKKHQVGHVWYICSQSNAFCLPVFSLLHSYFENSSMLLRKHVHCLYKSLILSNSTHTTRGRL